MIKFFRRTRQQLIKENRAGKYLLYAIGEIVLVVIGILIALQINNANENGKLEVIKQGYYEQLLLDLDKDLEEVHSNIAWLENSIASYNTYIDLFKKPALDLLQVPLAANEVQAIGINFAYNSNTIETLESTGDIKLMSLEIRNKLMELKDNQASLITIAEGNEVTYQEVQFKARSLGWGPIYSLIENQPKLQQDLDIKSNAREIILTLDAAFSMKNFSEILSLKASKVMVEDIGNLKKLIQQEIKQK